MLPLLAARGWTVDPAWRTPAGGDTARYLDAVLRALGNRFSDLARVPDQIACFFTEDYPVDAAVGGRRPRAPPTRGSGWRSSPRRWRPWMTAPAPRRRARFEEVARGTAARLGVEPGALLHPCRVALTGQNANARIFPVMELIGAPRVVARLRRAAAAG